MRVGAERYIPAGRHQVGWLPTGVRASALAVRLRRDSASPGWRDHCKAVVYGASHRHILPAPWVLPAESWATDPCSCVSRGIRLASQDMNVWTFVATGGCAHYRASSRFEPPTSRSRCSVSRSVCRCSSSSFTLRVRNARVRKVIPSRTRKPLKQTKVYSWASSRSSTIRKSDCPGN